MEEAAIGAQRKKTRSSSLVLKKKCLGVTILEALWYGDKIMKKQKPFDKPYLDCQNYLSRSVTIDEYR